MTIDLLEHIAMLEATIERKSAELDALRNAPTLFEAVMTSSQVLVERFNGELTLLGSFAKMNEEYSEFMHAASAIIDPSPDDVHNIETLRMHAASELIDLLVTAGGVAAYIGLAWPDIEAASRAVLQKNADKTTETHVWHEGTKTVMRKSKLGEAK